MCCIEIQTCFRHIKYKALQEREGLKKFVNTVIVSSTIACEPKFIEIFGKVVIVANKTTTTFLGLLPQ